MQLPNYELFLGIRLKPEVLSALNEVDPEVKNLFVSGDGKYLSEVKANNSIYLGKFVGKVGDLSMLKLLEINIISILSKLIPSYSFEKEPLLLIPAEQSQPSILIEASSKNQNR